MDQIKVSVIVPVYNVEPYLPKCLDSLVAQTLDEIEIIVVNDGSPDNSQQIIDEYAAKYPCKIKAYTKENGGLSDARNYGVAKASGEYIGFIDSDDFVDEDMFASLYEKAVETDSDVVCCPLTNEYEGKTVKTSYDETVFGVSVKENPQIIVYANSVAPNKIYRRTFWLTNEFQFPVGQWFEDSYLIYNVMLKANRVGCVNVPFMHYVRDREGSITNRYDPRLYDILKSAESIIRFYRENQAFEACYSALELVCLRHLLARVSKLRFAPSNKEACGLIDGIFDILDRNFPEWRKNPYVQAPANSSITRKIYRFIQRRKKLLKLYVGVPTWLYRFGYNLVNFINRGRKKIRYFLRKKKIDAKKQANAEVIKEEKRAHIQANGMAVLHHTQEILREIDVTSFADFGTCLGLIREGHLLAHDLDMDVGVIAAPEMRSKIRTALERNGYRLWRTYSYKGNPVEESYTYMGIKIDLNFYEMTDEYARTWLFYYKPGYKYEDSRQRHVVQMTYSPIKGVKHMEFDGSMIALPENPELLLEEKYGPTWRTPDKGWIYWESPAAVKLDEIDVFTTCSYTGRGFNPPKES